MTNSFFFFFINRIKTAYRYERTFLLKGVCAHTYCMLTSNTCYHVGWLNSLAIGLCVSTTTTVKTKAVPVEIEAPRQVLDHNLIFWL